MREIVMVRYVLAPQDLLRPCIEDVKAFRNPAIPVVRGEFPFAAISVFYRIPDKEASQRINGTLGVATTMFF